MLHSFEGPFKGHNTEDRSRKSTAPGGNQTHDLSVTRCALYRCATMAARQPIYLVLMDFWIPVD